MAMALYRREVSAYARSNQRKDVRCINEQEDKPADLAKPLPIILTNLALINRSKLEYSLWIVILTLAAIVTTPLALVGIFGIEDKTKEFFKYDTVGDYQTGKIKGKNQVVYNYGLMVSHWSMIVVVTIVMSLIYSIVAMGVYEKLQKGADPLPTH